MLARIGVGLACYLAVAVHLESSDSSSIALYNTLQTAGKVHLDHLRDEAFLSIKGFTDHPQENFNLLVVLVEGRRDHRPSYLAYKFPLFDYPLQKDNQRANVQKLMNHFFF